LTVFFIFCTFFPCAEASKAPRVSSSYQHYIEGLIFDNLGEYELAKDAYLKATKTDSQAWDLHYRLALDYVRLKDFKNAEREFRFLLKIRPYAERARYLLALVCSYRSKFNEAAKQYRILLERPLLEISELYIRYSLGHLHILKGDLENAESEYQRIIKDHPGNSEAHFYLGYIYAEASEFDKAINEFSRSIELNSNNAAALNSLSYLYAEREINLDEAFSLVKKALEIEPSNGAYLDTLGWVYFKKGDFENARRYLENAAVLFRDAEIFDHLGDVYLELEMFDKAKKNWKIALEMDPTRKQIKDKLKQLKRRK